MSEAAQRKGKPKVENRKAEASQRQKNARYLLRRLSRSGVQRTNHNAWRKLEVPMPAAMFWQDQGEKSTRTVVALLIIQNSYHKKKVSLEGQRAQKEDRFFRGRQIVYMIYDYFWFIGAHDTVLDYADLFTMILRNDDVQEIRYEMGWICIVNDQDPIWWRLGKFVQIENKWVWSTHKHIGIVRHGKFIRKDQKTKTMVKRSIVQKLRSGTSTLQMREWKQEQWLRIEGVNVVLKDAKENAINGMRKDSDREDTFPARWWNACKTDTKTGPFSEPPTQKRRNASKKKNHKARNPSGKVARQPCKHYLKCTCTKSRCENYWYSPECQFQKSASGCKFGEKCSFVRRQVEGQPSKKQKKMLTKKLSLFWKVHDRWVANSDTEPPESLLRLRKRTKVLRFRLVIQTSEKTKVRRSSSHNFSSAQSVRFKKFEDRSQDVIERQERCARGDALRSVKHILKLKERDKATFSNSPKNGVSQRHP